MKLDLSKVSEETVKEIAKVYVTAMEKLELEPGSVMFGFSEDETATKPSAAYVIKDDGIYLNGFCGLASRAGEYIHQCDMANGCMLKIAANADAFYTSMERMFGDNRLATYMRLILVNPLLLAS